MSGKTIYIDGSYGEGGGQVLRNSTALAAILGKPLEIENIRAGRPKPGLRHQHMAGLQFINTLCNGRLTGDKVGSTKLTFDPKEIGSGEYTVDPKTAGSTSLIVQVSLPVLLFGSGKSVVNIRGGTNVEFSPPIDEMMHVFKPLATRFGFNFKLDLVQRGFNPQGGGVLCLEVEPVRSIKAIELLNRGEVTKVTGTVWYSGNVREKVIQAIASKARTHLTKYFSGTLEQEEGEDKEAPAAHKLPAGRGRTRQGGNRGKDNRKNNKTKRRGRDRRVQQQEEEEEEEEEEATMNEEGEQKEEKDEAADEEQAGTGEDDQESMKKPRTEATPTSEQQQQQQQQQQRQVAIEINMVHDPRAIGNAAGISLVAETDTGCIFGASATSEAKKDPPYTAKIACKKLIAQLDSGACVDEWTQDQLIIFMGLAEGVSRIRAGPLTGHTQTAIHMVEKISKARFEVTEDVVTMTNGKQVSTNIITCHGIGFKNK